MNRINFSDWQEMALKKDVEDIKRKIITQEPILFSVCWEIILALATIIVDHLFDTEKAPIWVWILVIALAVIPPILVVIYKFICWIKDVHSVRKGKLQVRSYIDMFDNQISYWVMMGNSYADMLTEMVTNPSAVTSDAEKEFLYREGCYYNNKSMQALYDMKPNFSAIFSPDLDKVKNNNLIDIARVHNLLSVMHEQQAQLNRDISSVHSEGVNIQKNLNSKYTQQLKEFLRDFNSIYGNMPFEWEDI